MSNFLTHVSQRQDTDGHVEDSETGRLFDMQPESMTESRVLPVISMGKGTLSHVVQVFVYGFAKASSKQTLHCTALCKHFLFRVSFSKGARGVRKIVLITHSTSMIMISLFVCPLNSNSGCTNFIHKLDALVYVLALEANTGNRQKSLADYCARVVSCLSDQGASKVKQLKLFFLLFTRDSS